MVFFVVSPFLVWLSSELFPVDLMKEKKLLLLSIYKYMSPLLEKGYLGSQDQQLVKIHFLTVIFFRRELF